MSLNNPQSVLLSRLCERYAWRYVRIVNERPLTSETSGGKSATNGISIVP